MSRGSVNKVILIGHLGQEPEVRQMAQGGGGDHHQSGDLRELA